jgi:Enterobacterial TraT complement resistance protein
MRYFILPVVLMLSLTTGCANVVRSGLLNSNSVMMPPGMERTIYVHVGNISENQEVSLNGIPGQLSVKGYQVVKDPAQAHYWLQAHVVYCHKAKPGVTAESVAQTGFGAGIGSGGAAMAGANPFMFSGSGGQQQMPDINAMMSMAMAGSMGGMKQPPPEGILYMCVADVLVTEQTSTTAAKTVATSTSQAATYTMRSVGHVIQKELNIAEATPIIQEKLTIGIAGLF